MLSKLKNFNFKNHGYIYMFNCRKCGEEKNWLLCSRETYVDIFLTKKEYVIMCPECSNGQEIDKETFKDYKKIADINTEFLVKKITQVEYMKKLNNYVKEKLVNSADIT
ncbi:MAG: hypothetical protein ABF289_17055 [Clostridiales bacterium]